MYAKIILDTTKGQTEERYFVISEVNRTVSERGPYPLLRLHKAGGATPIVMYDMNNSGLVVYIENENGDTLQVYRGPVNPESPVSGGTP